MGLSLPAVRSLSLCSWILISYLTHFITASSLNPLILNNLTNASSSRLGAISGEDPRFSITTTYDETSLPVTPLLMNAVELLAQYASLNHRSRTRRRHGIVLPTYPSVEFAVLPFEPATTIEIRFVIWALYSGVAEMVTENIFNQIDIEFSWEGKVIGNIYITRPLDEPSSSTLSPSPNPMIPQTLPIPTNLAIPIGRFSWTPMYRPRGANLPPKDIFITMMSVIKVISSDPMDRKIEGPYQISSLYADAHVEVYLSDMRQSPRPKPPFLQYKHLLETARRVPGWMLQNRRFAEVFCGMESAGMMVGQMLLAKGEFMPRGVRAGMEGERGNLSVV